MEIVVKSKEKERYQNKDISSKSALKKLKIIGFKVWLKNTKKAIQAKFTLVELPLLYLSRLAGRIFCITTNKNCKINKVKQYNISKVNYKNYKIIKTTYVLFLLIIINNTLFHSFSKLYYLSWIRH